MNMTGAGKSSAGLHMGVLAHPGRLNRVVIGEERQNSEARDLLGMWHAEPSVRWGELWRGLLGDTGFKFW